MQFYALCRNHPGALIFVSCQSVVNDRSIISSHSLRFGYDLQSCTSFIFVCVVENSEWKFGYFKRIFSSLGIVGVYDYARLPGW